MKITVVGPTYPFRGGISHYNTLLCENLSKKHKVNLISFKRLYPSFLYPGRDQKDKESKRKIETKAEYILDSLNPLTWIEASLKVRKERPDLLIFHWWTLFFTFAFLTISFLTKKLTDTKVLFVCHNVVPHERTSGDKLLTKIAFRNIDWTAPLA